MSAALIVRDEENHLDECLRSLRGFVDEMVVVDTGSRDATVEIAESHGARVFFFPWCDDFSAARNEALGHASGEWILYIDADERLVSTDDQRGAARAIMRRRRVAGCYLHLRAHRGCGGYRELRLFRNHPEIRFEGIMHENIWPSLDRYLDETGACIANSGLSLDHVGYEGRQDHKHERDRPMILRELERKPNHIFCWLHLGRIDRACGSNEAARKAFQSAIEAGRADMPPKPIESLAWAELIDLELTTGGSEAKERAHRLLAGGLKRFPAQPQLLWLRVRLLMMDDTDLEAANAILRRLLRYRPHPEDDLGFDERLFGLYPAEALARNLYRQGRYGEAATYYAIAERCSAGAQEYKVKRRLCDALALRAASTVGPEMHYTRESGIM